MARLKIGHTRLTHEHRLKGVAEPMCQECNAILTVEHILLNCKKYENSRKNHLKNVTSMKNVFDNNECKTILNFQINYGHLVALVNQLPSPFLIMGDFNAHNEMWGSTKLDERGRTVERLMDRKNLCLFNIKVPTYHHPGSGTYSSIDLTLCHNSIFAEFQWKVHEDLCGSDHFPILLQTQRKNENNQKVPTWKTHRVDWDSFRDLCKVSFLPWELASNQRDPVQYFTDTLLEVSALSIPKTSKFSPKEVPAMVR